MQTTSKQAIGKRIRKLRRARDLSQTALGELAGCHYTAISGYERGESMPRFDTLEKLARALDVTVTALIEEDAS